MQTERRFTIGAGSPRPGFGGVNIFDLAQYSPQIAYARMKGVQFAPFLLSIRNTFNDSTPVSQVQSLENGASPIVQPSICDQVVYSVTAPNAFPGSVWKPQYDYYYQRQSGITATLNVTGAPRYAFAEFFTPLDTLLSQFMDAWPAGWVLGYTQNIQMQFQQTIPVPTTPTNIVVTFRLWQPIGTDDFQMMSAQEARNRLKSEFNIDAPGAYGLPAVPR